MMREPDNIDTELAALRAGYASRLPKRAEEIVSLWMRLQTTQDGEVRRLLQRTVHTFAGSAATYGFGEISAAARRMDHAIALLRDGAVTPFESNAIANHIHEISQLAVLYADRFAHPPHIESGARPALSLMPWAESASEIVPPVEHSMPSAPTRPISPLVLQHDGHTEAPACILIADDDIDLRRLFSAWLRGNGFCVTAVETGEAALLVMEHHIPDLLFLDAMMPGINGLQILEHVRDNALDLSVILTTSFGSEEIAIDALRRGADDYFRKTVHLTELQIVLERNLARLGLRRQNRALQQRFDEQRRRLETELSRAAQVQSTLLPTSAPDLSGFTLAAHCIPAREVGGDFYDWHIPAPGILNLTFGDVMGKGMPAAILMSTVRAVFRAVARQTPPIINMRYAVGALEPDLDHADSFVTLFHAQLDIAQRQLRYVDAGHGLCLVRRANGTIQELPLRGVPIGVPATEPYEEGLINMEPGDALIIFSDGLLDPWPPLARNPAAALADLLAEVHSAQGIIERLLALPALVGPCQDDLTVVALMCNCA